MVQMAGIEPARFIQPQDFKSCASTSSATSACIWTDKNYFTTFWYSLSSIIEKFLNLICRFVKHISHFIDKCSVWYTFCDIHLIKYLKFLVILSLTLSFYLCFMHLIYLWIQFHCLFAHIISYIWFFLLLLLKILLIHMYYSLYLLIILFEFPISFIFKQKRSVYEPY